MSSDLKGDRVSSTSDQDGQVVSKRAADDVREIESDVFGI